MTSALADKIPPERAVRRYLQSTENGFTGVEMHYQVARGRRMVIYDSMRGRADEFESRGGSARSSDTQEWRLKPNIEVTQDSLRRGLTVLMSDHAWHPIYEIVSKVIHLVTHDDNLIRQYFGRSFPYVPEEMRRYEAARHKVMQGLADIGCVQRGRRAGLDKEYRLPTNPIPRHQRKSHVTRIKVEKDVQGQSSVVRDS